MNLTPLFLNNAAALLQRIETLAETLAPHLNHDPSWVAEAITAHMDGQPIPEEPSA